MQNEKKWLVAVSGGPDSMALLDMCIQKGMSIFVAHVNYHHRKEADEEERYVVSYCKERDIPVSVRNEPFVSHGNFEADARTWRYDFFVKTVKENHLAGVLVAHHMDDLIETYLMMEEKNLEPSYYGLRSEMMYHGILVKRPLLSYTKAQLQKYCDERGIRYYIDSTNLSDEYTRNRIRHSIVEKLSDSERKMFLHEIERKNAEKQERICRVKTYVHEGEVSLKLYRSMNEEDRYALLRVLLEKENELHRKSRAHLHEIDEILMKKKDFIIDNGETEIVQKDGYFFLHQKSADYCDVYYNLNDLKECRYAGYAIEKGEPGVFALTLREDDFPVCIRNVRDSDEIQMRFGKKNVHRFFIDRHIPRFARKQWPIVENRHKEVIFVSGLGCDVNHYSVNPDLNVISLFYYSSK